MHPAAAQDKGQKKAEENPGWVLAHHSFERTLTYDDRLGDWLASAATMALRDRLQILPPVPDRHGLFWNKRAASTQNFEVSFTYNALPQRKDGPEDGQFAFWFSPDNFTATFEEQAIVTVRNWTKGLEDAGLTVLSNRPNFRGIGVMFLGLDSKGEQRPSVSAVVCDGVNVKELKLADFPAAQDAQAGHQQTKYIDWRKKDVQVKIRAELGKTIVGTLQVSKEPAVELFRLPAETTGAWLDTFLGFSGWSGSNSFLELDMSRLEMRNFDTKRVGEAKEESQDSMYDELGDAEGWKKVLEDEKRYIDQKSQKEAVERLTKLLGDYVDRYNKMGEKVKTDLVWLEKRMQSLDGEVNTLIGSSKAVNPETGNIDAESLKEHIVGIRSILTKDKEKHDEKFNRVHEVAKSLKVKGGDVLGPDGRAKVASVAEQAKTLEAHVNSGTTQTSSLLVVLVLAVCALGLLFLNRMRYYEKKHYI